MNTGVQNPPISTHGLEFEQFNDPHLLNNLLFPEKSDN